MSAIKYITIVLTIGVQLFNCVESTPVPLPVPSRIRRDEQHISSNTYMCEFVKGLRFLQAILVDHKVRF